jgi:hypothetical protein
VKFAFKIIALRKSGGITNFLLKSVTSFLSNLGFSPGLLIAAAYGQNSPFASALCSLVCPMKNAFSLLSKLQLSTALAIAPGAIVSHHP